MSILAPNRKPTSRYQPRPREPEDLPPRWRPPATWERHPPGMPLWRFVVLSMLLHALFILLFGAPSGGSREGRALWGSSSLDVVIRDPFRVQEPAPMLRFDRGLGSLAPSPAVVPPAATKASPQSTPPLQPQSAAAPEHPAASPSPPVLDRIEHKEPPAFEVPKPSERLETPRVERALAEPKIEPPPPAPKPIQVPKIELPVAPRIEKQLAEPPKVEAPPPPPQPIEVPRIEAPAVPRVDRQLLEPPRIEVPAPPPRPIEVPRIEAPVVPRVERQFIEPPKIEVPAPLPRPIDVPPIETPVMPRVDRRLAEPPSIEAPLVPPRIETPALQPKIEAPVVQPLEASRVPAPRTAPTNERDTRATPGAPAAAPRSERDSTPSEQGATPSPFRTSPAPRVQDNYDPTAPVPKLDVDAMRKRAAELTRAGTGNRAVLPFPMPPVDKPRTRMEDAIEKARKPDCRTAYKDLGLLAVVPLVANQFGEGTCRW